MPILIFSKRGERMRQSARHIFVPHGNEVYVNNWCAWRIREYTIKKILKNRSSRDFFNFIYCVSRGFRPTFLKQLFLTHFRTLKIKKVRNLTFFIVRMFYGILYAESCTQSCRGINIRTIILYRCINSPNSKIKSCYIGIFISHA